MKSTFLTFVFALLFSANLFAQSLTVDAANAKVTFKVPAENVTGSVTGLEAKIIFNTKDLSSSSIKGSIPVATVSTGSKMRDKHLQNDEFFDAAKHPKMEFTSSKIEKTENGYTMTGKLTIKGISKDTKISFTFNNNIFEGKMVLYTNDFDLNVQKVKEDSKVLVKLTVPVK